MYLGQHVRVRDCSIAPTLNGKVGVIAKVRDAENPDGSIITLYRVYVPGHPLLEWITGDFIEPAE